MTVNILGKSLRGDTVTSNAHKHTKLNIKIDHEIKSLAARVFHSFIHSEIHFLTDLVPKVKVKDIHTRATTTATTKTKKKRLRKYFSDLI